jgi:hypothetical protein
MLKALLLIFKPATTWDGVVREQRGAWSVLGLFLVPAVLVAGALEGWGMVRFGHQPANLDFSVRPLVV